MFDLITPGHFVIQIKRQRKVDAEAPQHQPSFGGIASLTWYQDSNLGYMHSYAGTIPSEMPLHPDLSSLYKDLRH